MGKGKGEWGGSEGESGEGVKGEVEERETAPLTLCSVKLSTVHLCDHYEKRGGGEGGGGGGGGGRGRRGGGGGITDLFSNNISQGSVIIIQSR